MVFIDKLLFSITTVVFVPKTIVCGGKLFIKTIIFLWRAIVTMENYSFFSQTIVFFYQNCSSFVPNTIVGYILAWKVILYLEGQIKLWRKEVRAVTDRNSL